ncbi:MAG: hypothetical protein JSS96_00520 [Bacteroidetes bacterium]|nr:hypothetical protein [Bacteroidota bacterium]
MKKLFLGILCLLFCISLCTNAQTFNNKYTYTDFSGTVFGIPRDLISSGGGTMALGKLTTSAPPYYPNFFLQQTNDSGTLITLLTAYFYSTTGTTVTLEAQKVLKNVNGYYIVAGYIGSSVNSIPTNPFVAKINPSGAVVWAYGYNTNTKLPPNNFVDTVSRVCIVDNVDSLGNPVYIVSAPSNESITSAFPSDAYINIFKIDDNGNLVWNFKYFPAGRSSAPYATLKEAPSTLIKISDNSYFISGRRDEIGRTGADSTSMFLMMFDNNGNITKSYRKFGLNNSSLELQDAAFYSDSIYIVYKINNQRLIANPPYGLIGITNVDLNLTHLFTKYYNYPGASYLYGSSIKATSDNHFVIGCVAEENSGATPANAILKISPDGTPVFFKKYNWLSQTSTNQRKYIVRKGTSPFETYTLLSDFNSGFSSVRLLTTNQSGVACGELDTFISATKVAPSQVIISYTKMGYFGKFTVPLTADSLFSNPTPCDTSNPGHKSPDAYVMDNNELKVYPTLFYESGAKKVYFELYSNERSRMTVRLFSIDGRKLFEGNLSVAMGTNKIACDFPALQPGNYFITTSGQDVSFNKLTRITVQ